jgi:tetratricopeptide (TPR) repeat protein
MTRWRIACDTCDASAWIGPADDGLALWCEGCQQAVSLADESRPVTHCARCGQPLTTGAPRFEELYGRLQEIAAVVAAWDGDPEPLGRLLPERPRLITDRTPPEPSATDAAPVRDALAALIEGRWGLARERLEPLLAPGEPTARDSRLWRAVAIAAERLGDRATAEAAWNRVLETLAADAPARLGRGALRAARGDYAGARDDFAHAGEGYEACWDRAAVLVLEAIAREPGLPPPTTVAVARAEAPTPTGDWIEPSIGRLLFATLFERALARVAAGGSREAEGALLAAAERELEFDTYWDRALVVHAYARLGLAARAAGAAREPVARWLVALGAEPAIAGPAGATLAVPLATAIAAVEAGDAHAARVALDALCAREDLRRYRVPCARCGRGTIGVESFDETETAEV